MRVFQTISGRPDWYDRNPVNKSGASVQLAVAPHADTTRASYSVPASKKAYVDSISVAVTRVTAAAPAALADAWCYFLGGIMTANFPVYANTYGNTIDAGRQANAAASALLNAAEAIEAHDRDLSTGGTVTFICSFKVVEFDA